MNESPTACRSIFAAVTALSFSAQQEKDCVDFITRRHDNTEIAPISDEAQLALKADGRLVDSDYRFNLISFLAVCQVISGGLSRVFGEVSGEMPSKLFDADSCSIPAAVSIYNTALRVRFDTLRERSILLDHTSRTVDGFLGLNHKMLDNVAFYALLKDRLAGRRFAGGFQRAELVGRELRIYIVDTATKTNDLHTNPAHTFASGWYFCNREDSGNAIRAIPCLFTKFGIAALPEQRDYRLVHVGSDLVGKASAMFTKALNYTFDMDLLRKRIPAMCDQKLGFTEARAQRNAVTQKWVTTLIQRGVHKNAALAILKNTMEVGADLEPRNLLDVFTDKVLMERSVYDLFCAICRYARNQPTAIRERLQATSTEFLFSVAKLPRST
jgi:hypothetical protein